MMETNEKVFEATSFEKYLAVKKRKVILTGFLLLLALTYLGSAIYNGNAIGIIGGSIYTLLNGIFFIDNYRRKPVRLIISRTGIFMQQNNLDLEVEWGSVTKAVYNGRYLDLYEPNSVRNTFDLQLFPEDQREAILIGIEEHINRQNLSIKHIGHNVVSSSLSVG